MKDKTAIVSTSDDSPSSPAVNQDDEVTRISSPVTQVVSLNATGTEPDASELPDAVTQSRSTPFGSIPFDPEATQIREVLPAEDGEDVSHASENREQGPSEFMEQFARAIWKKVKVNLDHLFIVREVKSNRVGCYAEVLFTAVDGRNIARGRLTDLSDKSGGFLIEPVEVNVHDVIYLEFLKPRFFDLMKVKVIVRRVQPLGDRIKIGVEFVDASMVFRRRLDKYLRKWRNETIEFDHILSRW